MARKHYWQFLVTDEGNPIENAQISIYEAGTDDPVWVYTDEVGTAGTSSAPQVVTSRKGYFEFWIADQNEVSGYPLSTKFKIAWAAAGVSTGYIDYVDVFSTSWAPVDETDTDPLKNKAVSNFLAKGWEDHWQEELPDDNPHGLGFVDESDNTNNLRNKVLSNYLGYLWDNHTRTLYDGTIDTIAVGDPSQPAHGIEQGNPAPYLGYYGISGDTLMNKLTSNDLIYQSDSHVRDTNRDDHTQYASIWGGEGGGYRSFQGAIGYGATTGITYDSLTPDDFVTKGMLGGLRYEETILSTDWIINLSITSVGGGYSDGTFATTGGSGDGNMTVTITTYGGALVDVVIASNGVGYKTNDVITVSGGTLGTFILNDIYYQVNHNLGSNFPVVFLWDLTADPDEVIYPESIIRGSTNDTIITLQTAIDCQVKVLV